MLFLPPSPGFPFSHIPLLEPAWTITVCSITLWMDGKVQLFVHMLGFRWEKRTFSMCCKKGKITSCKYPNTWKWMLFWCTLWHSSEMNRKCAIFSDRLLCVDMLCLSSFTSFCYSHVIKRFMVLYSAVGPVLELAGWCIGGVSGSRSPPIVSLATFWNVVSVPQCNTTGTKRNPLNLIIFLRNGFASGFCCGSIK